MYKIYINETPLQLCSSTELSNLPAVNAQNLVGRYNGQSKFLLQYIDMLEKTDRFENISIYSDDYDALVNDFEGLYKIIEAAGGLVFNKKGEVLFIYRRGFWDLPKGKIEKKETITEAAIREVQEETGINQLTLGQSLITTHHTYRSGKGKRILKRSYWYEMHTLENELIPQTEEDIEVAVWMSMDQFLSEKRVVYKNILSVLKAYKKNNSL